MAAKDGSGGDGIRKQINPWLHALLLVTGILEQSAVAGSGGDGKQINPGIKMYACMHIVCYRNGGVGSIWKGWKRWKV